MERDKSLDEVIRQMERESRTAELGSASPDGLSAADILTQSLDDEPEEPSAECLLNEALQAADILRAEFREQFQQMRREQQLLLDQLKTLTEALDRSERESCSNAA